MAHQHESARPKRVDADALPQQAPMKQGGSANAPKVNQALSADQKKIRREMRRRTAGAERGLLKQAEYADGFVLGYDFGRSFICRDPASPWNTEPERRTRMIAARMPRSVPVERAGSFISGFARGVHEATVVHTDADKLQPGDAILGPTGQVVRVKRVRNHETNNKHVYVDTDAGTSLVERRHQFQRSPHNTVQQEIPGFGIPGANTNTVPFGRSPGKEGPGNAVSQSAPCPNCGAPGSMVRRGGTYVCSRCGYHEQTGPLGPNSNLLDSERVIKTFNSLDRTSAIARRAREVLTTLEDQ